MWSLVVMRVEQPESRGEAGRGGKSRRYAKTVFRQLMVAVGMVGLAMAMGLPLPCLSFLRCDRIDENKLGSSSGG